MTFVILILLSVALFLAAQWLDHRTNNSQNVWLIYALPLIVFVLTFGLRDGWFQDYVVYETAFQNPMYDDEYEPFFVLVNRFLRLIGFSVPGAMTVYAAFAILGTFWCFAYERKYLGIGMAVFAVMGLWSLGLLIRWMFAVGLVYVGVRYLSEKKWALSAIFFLLGICVHLAIGLVVGFFLIFYFLNPFRNLWVVLSLMAASLLLTRTVLASFLGDIVEGMDLIPSNLHLSGYAESQAIDYFFEGDDVGDMGDATLLGTLRNLLTYAWFVIWGYKELRSETDSFWKIAFNSYAFAAILFYPTSGIELTLRFQSAFCYLGCLLIGRIIYNQFKRNNVLCGLFGIVLLLYNLVVLFHDALKDYVIAYVDIL